MNATDPLIAALDEIIDEYGDDLSTTVDGVTYVNTKVVTEIAECLMESATLLQMLGFDEAAKGYGAVVLVLASLVKSSRDKEAVKSLIVSLTNGDSNAE